MYDLPRRYSRGSQFVSRPKRIAVYLPLSTQMLGWLNLLKINHNHCQILTASAPFSFVQSHSTRRYLKIVCLFQLFRFVYEDFIKRVKMPFVLLTELICPHVFCFSSFKLAFFKMYLFCVFVAIRLPTFFHLLYMDPILFFGSFLL
jgi:hypothetical protein